MAEPLLAGPGRLTMDVHGASFSAEGTAALAGFVRHRCD